VSSSELVARARLLHALGEAGGSLAMSGVEGADLAAAIESLEEQGLVQLGDDGRLRVGPRGSRLSAARIRELRRGARYGAAAEVRAVVDSTNDAVLDRAAAGGAPGLVIAAELQTRGRGTKGRTFLSPPGLGVWSTTLLDAPAEPAAAPRASLVAALAVAVAVERLTGVRPSLKWPNDVRLGERKVCGVLVEARSRGEGMFLVAGIGVNVHHRAEDFPPELRPIAGALEAETGARLDRSELLAEIVAELEAHTDEDRRGRLDLAARWSAWDELAGRDVEVRIGDETLAGRADGLEDDGRLRVRGPGGSVRAIRSAETAVAVRGG
jgi:BirA family biotin operon repressor/biotin-[acetyl-CoA-carboxylase] ligase